MQGEHDEFGGAPALSALVDPLPEPRALVVIAQADHFFNGHLEELQQAVSDWAARSPWG